MSLKGKLIYDGGAHLLYIQFRLFMRRLLFCPMFAALRETGAMRQAAYAEKLLLLAGMGEMVKPGISPETNEFEEQFENFCQAVFARGHVVHEVFFGQVPWELAEFFA
ncbi:MAG: hypothetical protein ACTHOL_17460 [Luteibacter jiangsuensis]